MPKITDKQVNETLTKLKKEVETKGYHLNPDNNFTKTIIKGLLTNQERYGYWLCPCRIGTGNKEKDKDITCPCDYRDADLTEYDNCFCALYVSKDVISGKTKTRTIPERRGKENMMKKSTKITGLKTPVWRCSVCGYLCAMNNPPETCPICGASKDRFEKFIE